MWELNYNDIFHPTISTSTSDIGSGNVPFWYQQREYLRLIEDALLETSGVPKFGFSRDIERKQRRKRARIRRINSKIRTLLTSLPVDVQDSLSGGDLNLLHSIVTGDQNYDYWPIPKILTRKLRGLVKKQRRRTVIVSLHDYVRIIVN